MRSARTRQANLRQVDIRQASRESHFVNGFKPYIQDLADAYGVSRQGLYCIMESNAFTRSELLNPDHVFHKLLDGGRRSPLRARLSNPTTRARIQTKISKL